MARISALDQRIFIAEVYGGWYDVSFAVTYPRQFIWATACASQAEAETAEKEAHRILQALDRGGE